MLGAKLAATVWCDRHGDFFPVKPVKRKVKPKETDELPF
jgi:hypothetical protein